MKKEEKLEKKFSPLSVWALAFGCIIGWGAFVMPGETFLRNAGPMGTLLGMVISIVIMGIIALNYNYMVNRYPLAGGEFKYTRIVFGGKHSYICAWFLALAYILPISMNSTALALIGRNLLNNVFQVGFHYNVTGYEVYLGEVLLAIFAVCLFGYLCIRGVEFAGLFQVILTIMLVFGVVVIGVGAIVSPKASLENLYPLFPDTTKTSVLSSIFAIIIISPWAFFGFDTIPQVAEEFKFSPRKTKMIMLFSIVFGGFVYIILNTVTASVIPDNYGSWVEYIEDASNLDGLISLPTFYAAYELLGKAGVFSIGIAVLAAVLSGIVGFYIATSRLLFSMSRDGVIPKWFGEVHSKYKTPRNAIVFLILISIAAPFFGRNALGWLVDMSSLGALIGYGYTSAATIKCAKEGKSITFLIMGWIGVCLAVFFTILLLIPIPGLNCSLGKESYICLIAWTILGMFFYMKERKRIDLS